MLSLSWYIANFGINIIRLYFSWNGTIKLIKFIYNVSYDFSKVRNVEKLPMIIYDRWF